MSKNPSRTIRVKGKWTISVEVERNIEVTIPNAPLESRMSDQALLDDYIRNFAEEDLKWKPAVMPDLDLNGRGLVVDQNPDDFDAEPGDAGARIDASITVDPYEDEDEEEDEEEAPEVTDYSGQLFLDELLVGDNNQDSSDNEEGEDDADA